MESLDNYKQAFNNSTFISAEFCVDLAQAQGEIEGAVKDSSNPFFKSNYADMASVIESYRKVFSKYGFSVLQPLTSWVANGETKWGVQTFLLHKSGQRLITDPVEIVIKEKNNPQAFGSAVTYFRRYAMASLLRIPQVDDDGNAATQAQKPMPPKPQPKPQFQRPT